MIFNWRFILIQFIGTILITASVRQLTIFFNKEKLDQIDCILNQPRKSTFNCQNIFVNNNLSVGDLTYIVSSRVFYASFITVFFSSLISLAISIKNKIYWT